MENICNFIQCWEKVKKSSNLIVYMYIVIAKVRYNDKEIACERS